MSKKLKYAVIAVVVVSFMFFGIYSTIAARKSYVAKVDGIKITMQEFNRYASNRKQQIFSNVEGDVVRQKQAMEFIQSKQFEEFVLNEMINTLVISKFLKESGVGVPAYYNKIDFEINGKSGQYARSRSGCFFCFFSLMRNCYNNNFAECCRFSLPSSSSSSS